MHYNWATKQLCLQANSTAYTGGAFFNSLLYTSSTLVFFPKQNVNTLCFVVRCLRMQYFGTYHGVVLFQDVYYSCSGVEDAGVSAVVGRQMKWLLGDAHHRCRSHTASILPKEQKTHCWSCRSTPHCWQFAVEGLRPSRYSMRCPCIAPHHVQMQKVVGVKLAAYLSPL